MSGYIGSTPVPQATQHRESFTCTEGQTSFATAGYTPQFVDVYLNGSHLSPADFTASNGSDVVLGVAASADDVCDIISYSPFEIADATFTGTTTTDVSLTTGVLTANGGAVFNEGSADVDFRVESNGNANMLFVDGGNDAVGIGTSSPNSILHISATSPHIDLGPDGSNLAKIGHHANDLYLGTTSGTGEFFFKKNVSSNDGPHSSGTLVMAIDGSGAVTKPLQPAFFANPNAVQSDIPINAHTNINFGTQRYDQNDDFQPSTGNGQGADTDNKRATFTAPVAGKYMLGVTLRLDAVDKDFSYFQIQLVATGRTLEFILSGVQLAADATYYTAAVHGLVEMDEGDTAYVNSYIPNSGAAQMDVSTSSYFYGYLVC